MALGANAELELAEKRVPIRITVMGSSECGKTSLINAFVNNIFHERHVPTTCNELYYTIFGCQMEEDKAALNFNTMLEIEDTPAFDHMDERMVEHLLDPYWPKPEELAMRNPSKDSEDKATGRRSSVNLPFSQCQAPVGLNNDEGWPTVAGQSTAYPGLYFCSRLDYRERKCGVNDRQCASCKRFQSSLLPGGEYKPLVRRRMVYFFVFDANDMESYKAALQMYSGLLAGSKKRNLMQTPLIYMVGSKIDKDPEQKQYRDISALVKIWARTEVESGNRVSTMMVSSAQYKGIHRLITNALLDVKAREPLWKMTPLGDNGVGAMAAKTCLQQ